MKFFVHGSLLGSGLGLLFLMASPSFATVVGNLYTGGSGTVTVTADGITFNENDTTGGSTEVGAGTTLTFAGGSLTEGQPIDIGGGLTITPASLPLTDFMTFPDDPNLSVTLDYFGPGSTNNNCAGLTTGESCSPMIGSLVSPIILTYTGSGTEGSGNGSEGVSALLNLTGTITDGSGIVSDFTGHFSASIANETPEQLVALFDTPGASFSTTYAGDFVASEMSAIPEPRDLSWVALSGLLLGLIFVRRRKSVA